jgi:hypothetical protein
MDYVQRTGRDDVSKYLRRLPTRLVSRSITITSPDTAANNTASNTAIMAVSGFFYVLALVIIDPVGRIRRGRGSNRAYAKDYQSTQGTQDGDFHWVSPFGFLPALLG